MYVLPGIFINRKILISYLLGIIDVESKRSSIVKNKKKEKNEKLLKYIKKRNMTKN